MPPAAVFETWTLHLPRLYLVGSDGPIERDSYPLGAVEISLP